MTQKCFGLIFALYFIWKYFDLTKFSKMLFILDDLNNPVEINDINQWERWMTMNSAKVELGRNKIGEFTVNTVFRGVDSNAHKHDQPMVFESTVYDDVDDIMAVREYQDYYDAMLGHKTFIQEYTYSLV